MVDNIVRKPATGGVIVPFFNGFIAGTPVYFPGTEDGKGVLKVTAICNLGTGNSGEERKTEINLAFWDGYAPLAAASLSVGRCIQGYGELRTHQKPSGVVDPNGKPIITREFEIRVMQIYFSGDTRKELTKTIDENLVAAKAAGFIPPNVSIRGEDLLKKTRLKPVPYNDALARKTGMWGNARIWKKGEGWYTQQNAGVAGDEANKNAAALQKELESMKAQYAALLAATAISAENVGANAGAGNAAAEVDVLE